MKPYPHQVLSKFREGLDTKDLATEFRVSESEICDLLAAARKEKFSIASTNFNSEKQKRAVQKSRLVCKTNKPVSLAPLKFLEGKA